MPNSNETRGSSEINDRQELDALASDAADDEVLRAKVIECARVGLTLEETVAELDVESVSDLEPYRAAYKRGLLLGTGRLKRKAYELGIAGNTSMMRLLLRNRTEYADNPERAQLARKQTRAATKFRQR